MTIYYTMIDSQCQDSKEDFENIKFVFFQSYNEKYYRYSINNLDNFHLIKREEITSFIGKLNYSELNTILWLTNRFFPFVYDNENKKLIELELFSNEQDVEQQIKNQVNQELKNSSLKEKENYTYDKNNLFSKIKDLHNKIIKS